MTTEETSKILSLIRLTYPQSYSGLNETDFDLLIEEWSFQFKNESYTKVYLALQYYVSISPYSPTIAAIKRTLYEMFNDNKLPNGEEAWSIVLKACRNSSSEAREEFEKLPDYLKDIVTIDALVQIGLSNQNEVSYLKNAFLKEYKSLQEKHRENYQISSISNSIKQLDYSSKNEEFEKLDYIK